MTDETAAAAAPPEPVVAFMFELSRFQHMSPLTKLDILDVVPWAASHFYYDSRAGAYALVIFKSHWDGLSTDRKRTFMLVARRIREETEGILTTHQRSRYENADLFEIVGGGTTSSDQPSSSGQ